MDNLNVCSCVVIGAERLVIQCCEILLSHNVTIKGIVSESADIEHWAADHGIHFIKQKQGFSEELKLLAFDYLFSITNLQVLPDSILSLARKESINFHDSLLPSYAGIHATSWAIFNGEEKHGITWHLMSKNVDKGKILGQKEVQISSGETAYSLNLKCFFAAIDVFSELVIDLDLTCSNAKNQTRVGRSYFGKHKKVSAGGVLSFSQPSLRISALVRALNFGGHPNTLGVCKLKVAKDYVVVNELTILAIKSDKPSGTVIKVSNDYIQIASLDNDILIKSLATLGGRDLTIDLFCERYKIEENYLFVDLSDAEENSISEAYSALSGFESKWLETLDGWQASELPYKNALFTSDVNNLTHSDLQSVNFKVPPKLSEYIAEQQTAWNKDDFIVFAFITLLIRLSENDYFSFGLNAREIKGREALISPTVPCTILIDSKRTLAENFVNAKVQLDSVKKNMSYPFDIGERFSTLLVNNRLDERFYSVTCVQGETPLDNRLESKLGKADLAFVVDNSGNKGCCVFDANVISTENMSKLMGSFSVLLKGCINSFDQALCELPVLSRQDKKKLVVGWNNTAVDYPKSDCFHEVFSRQALAKPDDIAAIYEGKVLTYSQLDQKSTELAIYLQLNGVQPNHFVAICMDRSLEMLIGLLAIQKSGGAYVPLDPAYPIDRLTYMLEDSQTNIILTHKYAHEKSKEISQPNKLRQAQSEVVIISIDEQWSEVTEAIVEQSLDNNVSSDDLIYAIYTSGSTGKPKGVMIPNKALVNFLFAMKSVLNIEEKDSFLALTTYCFDIAYLELYLPLLVGAKCIIASSKEQVDPDKLIALIEKHQPAFMQATPVTWKILFEAGWTNKERAKILCGGEPLSNSLLQEFIRTESESWNMYGPTETTIWSTCQKVSDTLPISIGKPIANTHVYIVDTHGEIVPVGVAGELWIAGDGLSKGYVNQADLTAEKFVQNPFSKNKGHKLFKTGDLARWQNDGTIECLGRIDQQVKVRGFRIELGEIESLLCLHPKIKQAIVIVQDNDAARLIAYFTHASAHQNTETMTKELHKYLDAKLPGYMIPAFFVAVSKLPLTPNGKIDRKTLAKKSVTIVKHAPVIKTELLLSSDEIKKNVLDLWQEVLQVEGIGSNDGFFEVGGNSLLAVSLARKIQTKFKCKFLSSALFKYSTIKSICEYIESQKIINGVSQNANSEILSNPSSTQNNVEAFSPNIQVDSVTAYPSYYDDSVAIIGISSHFPGASDHWKFWENLKAGKESVHFFSEDELKAHSLTKDVLENPNYVPVQSGIDGKELFDPDFFSISSANAEIMSPQLRQLLQHSWSAIEDAGYISESIPHTSVFMTATNFASGVSAPKNTSNEHVIKDANEYVSWLLNQEGTIPTMISYQLGFTGQSSFVHTNCSSSLTALNSAVQSLRSKEAVYSLVGGASLSSSLEMGYVYQPGLNFSSDGHLRTFDARADGMILGEGVGVVLLKRAVDAINDKDHIYAILRDVGINNDGSNKAGFYAPSVEGQSIAIQKVLEKTKINPESITYVEAHGTGTALGDPIEVMSLSETYKKYTQKKQYCVIGSVKPNIGHLDTVAGLAGFIKVAMSLYHGQIPPSINFSEPNSEIDFADTPFYVNQQLKPWESKGGVRRAALSSFGIGGTNTHAILEAIEFSARNNATDIEYQSEKLFLIPLSARNESNLEEYAHSFIEYLKSVPRTSIQAQRKQLDQLAYTMQTGRKNMDHRAIFLVNSLDDAVQALESFINKSKSDVYWLSGGKTKEAKNTLLDEEDTKELVDKWVHNKNYASLAKLWVSGITLDWLLLYSNGIYPSRISLPTYPFSKERYWLDSSTTQKEVNDSNQNISLIHPLLHKNTSVFSQQRFTSTFSGKEFFLADHIVGGEKTLPGVAYLEMVRAALEASLDEDADKISNVIIKNIVWIHPIVLRASEENIREVHIDLFAGSESNGEQHQIHYEVYTYLGSNDDVTIHSQGVVEYGVLEGPSKSSIQEIQTRMVDGVLSAASCYQAYTLMGIDYGLGHQGVKEIFRGENEVLAKISLPETILDTENNYILHPCLMDSALQASVGLMLSSAVLPDTHADLKKLNPEYLKLNLPFALKAIEIIRPCVAEMYVWVRYSEGSGSEDKVQKMDIELYDNQGNICSRIRGFTTRVLEGKIGELNDHGTIGTLIAAPEWVESVAVPLNQNNSQRLGYSKHIILTCELPLPESGLVDTIPGCHHTSLSSDQTTLAARFTEYAITCFNIVQKLMGEKHEKNVLIQIVTPNTEENSVFAGLSGLLKTAMIENPKIQGQLLQVDTDEPLKHLAVKLLENMHHSNVSDIKYLGEKRLVSLWREIEQDDEQISVSFKDNACYLITGGFGGLGILFAEEILRQTNNVTLILTGRSSISDAKETQIKALESLGEKTGQVKYFALDITNTEEMSELARTIQREYGDLNGVIHCAGVIADNFILKKSSDEFQEVLSPKVIGTQNLDELTRNMPLDFFVMFSSSVGSTGNVGQADYATANAFMNQFSAYRNALTLSKLRHGQTIAINWPLWKDGGMGVDDASEKMMRQTSGMVPMSKAVGVKAFYTSLQSQQSQTLVMEGVLDKLRSTFLVEDTTTEFTATEYSEAPEEIEETVDVVETITSNEDLENLEEKTQKFLKKQLSSVLKRPTHKIDAQAQLGDYGMDSILAMTLTNELESSFGSLSKTLFFEFQTIAELADYFIESYRAKLVEIFKLDTPAIAIGVTKEPKAEVSIDAPVILNARQKRRKPTFLPAPITKNSSLNDSPEIAIIGLSGRYPGSFNINEYWKSLRDGRDCITEVPKSRWDWQEYYSDDRNKSGHHYSKWGGFIEGVDEFDPLFFNISPREATELDPQERLFLEHAWTAIEDAGYTRETLHRPMNESSTGEVGVYAGSMYGEYQLFGAEESLKGNRTGFSSCLSSIANRVSYVLDLHGPSMTVDTMCSASLSCIHLASQDLKLGRTDIGIAGGVNVTIHPNKYLMLSAGQFLSTNGHCESFGEGGGGYIPAEGVGVVLLKRLEDAQRDGDQIYGVILASAVNHGGKTNGFNVPNLKAQRSLIERVISDSKVDPRHISYVEAHGTGTKLGDPIEVSALSQAYGSYTKEVGFCLLGSSKSNIGHCEGAAGIGGLSKVLLQMKYKKIVPSLHSTVLNPNIDFSKTPFVVNQTLRNWEQPVVDGEKCARIAGISSFGAGGSNAHLIVKEYQNSEVSQLETPAELVGQVMIPLSAKSPEQLEAIVRNLQLHIQVDINSINTRDASNDFETVKQGLELQIIQEVSSLLSINVEQIDIAHDLSEYGMDTVLKSELFEHLQADFKDVLNLSELIMQDSIESIVTSLVQVDNFEHYLALTIEPIAPIASEVTYEERSLSLMNLSYTLQVGREAMEERLGFVVSSLEELDTKLNQFLLGDRDIDDCYLGQVKQGSDTLSVFVGDDELQHAIDKWLSIGKFSKLLELWVQGLSFDWNKLYQGANPKRISLPAYPFARDKYWVVDRDASPTLALTHAPQEFNKLHPLIHENTSDIYEQRFTSRFNGNEAFLNDHQVKGDKILPGVAYLEMANIAVLRAAGALNGADFYQANSLRLSNIIWQKPLVIGSESQSINIGLKPSENSSSPNEILFDYSIYKAIDLNLTDIESTTYSQGQAAIVPKYDSVSLNVDALKSEMNTGLFSAKYCYETFQKMGLNYGPSHQCIQEISAGDQQLLVKLSVDSRPMASNGYVLSPGMMDSVLQSCLGFDMSEDNASIPELSLPFSLESLEIISPCKNVMFAWVRYSSGYDSSGRVQKFDIDLCDDRGNICVKFHEFSTRRFSQQDGLISNETTDDIGIYSACPVWKDQPLIKNIPNLSLSNDADHVIIFVNSFDEYANSGKAFTDLVGNASCLSLNATQDNIVDRFNAHAIECLHLVRERMASKAKGNTFFQIVISDELENSTLKALFGIFKTANIENPKIRAQLVQLSATESLIGLASKLIDEKNNAKDAMILYKDNTRQVASWDRIENFSEMSAASVKYNGVYVITGGFGGLGLIFAKDIQLKSPESKLILIGRSALTDEKMGLLESLSTDGKQVEYQIVDVSNLEDTQAFVDRVCHVHGGIDGIVHSAGVLADNYILRKTDDEFNRVLLPKVTGAYNLDQTTQDLDLDFLALFSSTSGVIGNAGQVDYVTANCFLDSFSEYRNSLVKLGKRMGKTVSINWPLWKEGGMSIDSATEDLLKETIGMVPMATTTGINTFYKALACNESQMLVTEGVVNRFANYIQGVKPAEETVLEHALVEKIDPPPKNSGMITGDNDSSAVPDMAEKAEHYIKQQLSKVLKLSIQKIDAQAPLEHYGMDSVLAMNLTFQLEKTFGALSKTLFFEYQTIAELQDYLLSSHEAIFNEMFKPEVLISDENAALNKVSSLSINHTAAANIKASTVRLDRFRAKNVLSSGAHPRSNPQVTRSDDHSIAATEIAIIGISGRYPQSNNLDDYWDNLKNSRDCITEVPEERWNWREFYTENRAEKGRHFSKYGGFIEGVDEFDPIFFGISPKEAKMIDPQERLFLEHSWNAMEDAGYTRESLENNREQDLTEQVGVYAGVMYGEYQLFGAEESLKGNHIGVPGNLASIANRVSYVFNLHGPSMTTDTMCSSSLTAIHLACQDLKLRRTSMAIAGGVNVTIHPNKYHVLSSGQFISTKGHCESFGEGGDGYIPAEGVGTVVLKRAEDAERDGDQIYGIIAGSAINHGGKTNGYSVPNPKAQRSVVEQALSDSKVDPRWISYVEAHGTGTKLGDPIEISALTKAFSSEERGFCKIGSSKSNIGHCEGAAGMGGLSKVLLQMKHKKIVPSLHSSTLNPNIDFDLTPFVVNQELIEWERPMIDGREIPRIAGISSFGAGGSNAHLIIKEHTASALVALEKTNASGVVVPLSARNQAQLIQRSRDLLSHLQSSTLSVKPSISVKASAVSIKATIESLLTQQLNVDAGELDSTQDLQEYGLDTFNRSAMLSSIQEIYATTLDYQEFNSQISIDAMVDWLVSNGAAEGDHSVKAASETDIGDSDKLDIDLNNLAFTLQVGREAMDYRVGFIVTSLNELEKSLAAFIAGEQAIENCYIGQVKKNKEVLSVISSEHEFKSIINSWMAGARHSKLLDLWVKGLAIDWQDMHANQNPKRISLPTYPFSKERYWLDLEDTYSAPPKSTSVEKLVDGILKDIKKKEVSPSSVLKKYGI
jgi:amino acid adenylation domain-containing protein